MEKMYKHILLAVELNSKVDRILAEKAKNMAALTRAKVTVVHAIEHIGSYGAAAYGIVNVNAEIEEILLKRAKHEMGKLGKMLMVSPKDQLINIGSAKVTILEVAAKRKVDLIIMGSRGLTAMRLLLGSTANAVLHHAKCDVLAVHIK